MREMTATSLKNTMQETINNLKNEEARNISSQISKAKAIAYLVTVASQVIEQERKFFLDDAAREKSAKSDLKWDEMEERLLSGKTKTP